jgi:hypothetical protein
MRGFIFPSIEHQAAAQRPSIWRSMMSRRYSRAVRARCMMRSGGFAAVGEFQDQRAMEIPFLQLPHQRDPVDRPFAGRQVGVAIAVVVVDVEHAQVAGELVDHRAQVFGEEGMAGVQAGADIGLADRS